MDFAAAALMIVAEDALAEEVEEGVCVTVRTVIEEVAAGAVEDKADEDKEVEVEIDVEVNVDVECNARLVVETRLTDELVVVDDDNAN